MPPFTFLYNIFRVFMINKNFSSLIISFVLILLFATFSFGQKITNDGNQKPTYPVDSRLAVSMFNCGKIENTDTSVIRQYLLSNIPNLRGEAFSVEYIEGRESKAGLHYLYRQNYQGKPVYRGTVKINMDFTGNILSIFDNTYPIHDTPAGTFPSPEDSYDIIKGLYHEENNLVRIMVENVYFDMGTSLIPASRIELWDISGNFFELVINSDATVVYERDMNSYFNRKIIHNIDTPALARIFNPDPLTTANVVYGTPYEDSGDADISQLNLQRQQVTIDVSFQNDTFKLEGPYCKITEHSTPDVAPATSLTPAFEFTRNQQGFEDVNAFYHINKYHDYVAEQLGFSNIVDYPIWVDTHGMAGTDNSNFSSAGSPPRISFGEGGVDDAEDADVIIHEYGHAIAYSAAPGTNSGTERNALDEGLGDYFAASYSKSINPYNWEYVFSWDGHNEFWNGRQVISFKHYPEDLQNQLYKDAELWSATMMQIMDNIGRENTDEVQIQALYSYASNMSMTDAAYLVIQADVLLHGGEFVEPIKWWMCSRGFIPCWVGIDETTENNSSILNSYGFAKGNENAVIRFNTPQNGVIQLTDATGRIVFSESFSGSEKLEISPETLSSGIYLTKVNTQNFSSYYKLVKW